MFNGEDEDEEEFTCIRYMAVFKSILEFNDAVAQEIATLGISTELIVVRDISNFAAGLKAAYRAVVMVA